MKAIKEGVINSNQMPDGRQGIFISKMGCPGTEFQRNVCAMPVSYSHSLPFPRALHRVSFYAMYLAIIVVTVFRVVLDVCPQILPRRGWGIVVAETSRGISSCCLSLPPFFFLCFIVIVNTRKLTFLNLENYLY
jgi:hypothetical protein